MPVTPGPIYPCNPYTARSETTKLGTDPKGGKVIYTNGRAVVIRDLSNPALSDVYTEHTQTATVARISPSGFYCASADIAGNVRIWDVTNPTEHVLKFANRPLSGKINDLAWDGESKRLVVAGEGRDKSGAAFFIDSGSSCGEITGHSKAINAIDVRHQRPFRAITGSDDTSVCLHTAVPFKYDKLLSHHTRFVQDVRYAPSGDLFASVGSDGKLIIYDGKTGDLKLESGNGEGGSTLMAASWAKDSSKLATAGADGVVTIWDATSGQSSQTFKVGSAVEDQQNGIVWTKENQIVSVSLSGTLNVFDPREGDKWRKLHGPSRAITAGALVKGGEKEQTFYAGSFDGSIKRLRLDGGDWDQVGGTGHSALVSSVTASEDKVWTAGWDDKAASIDISSGSFTSSSIPTKGQPTGIASNGKATFVSSSQGIVVQPVSDSGSNATSSFTHPGEYTAVAASPASGLIAFGSGKTLTLASLSGSNDKLQEEATFDDSKGDILSIEFTPDGSKLAAGDAAGRVVLIDVKEKKTIVSSRWTFHTGRVVALAFDSKGEKLASAGLDESVYVWHVGAVGKNTPIKNAHPGGVTAVAWTGDDKLITAGSDGCARTWTLSA